MTRRERLERKAEKRQEWAGKAEAEVNRRHAAADAIMEHIPFGQPILIGHHSEKRHRRALERMHTNMGAAVEAGQRAEHHESKAAGLQNQLDRSIFSDDDGAIEALEARIAERMAESERKKTINKEIRKGAGWEARLAPPLTLAEAADLISIAKYGCHSKPGYPPYSFANLNGRIRADRERIKAIQARQKRIERAEAAGGTSVVVTGEYASITFVEKPERAVLNALKAAGFHYSGGAWYGSRKNIPADLSGA